jgi:hypothetical protein
MLARAFGVGGLGIKERRKESGLERNWDARRQGSASGRFRSDGADPCLVYALASDTLIGVVRAWAIARKQATGRALADPTGHRWRRRLVAGGVLEEDQERVRESLGGEGLAGARGLADPSQAAGGIIPACSTTGSTTPDLRAIESLSVWLSANSPRQLSTPKTTVN